jgi:hypothetical protein
MTNALFQCIRDSLQIPVVGCEKPRKVDSLKSLSIRFIKTAGVDRYLSVVNMHGL